MAVTRKTKRVTGAKATKKKTSRTAASKTKRSRSSASATSAKKSRSRATAKKGASKTTAKRPARKAPARKRSTRPSAAKTSTTKRVRNMKASNTTKEDRQFLQQHADELSRTTERARWIHSPDEHEDHPGQTLATRNHDVIRRWAEERHAVPATVPSTAHGDRAGVLPLDFPGYGGGNLQHIGWDEWFAPFDDRELVFVFQEHKSDGSQSNFFHLDNPNRGHE